MYQIRCLGWYVASLWGSVGKDFVYHACGHGFESQLKCKFSNFPHHLWQIVTSYFPHLITCAVSFINFLQLQTSLCGSVGKDFVYHAYGHRFESRLKCKFSDFPHHLRLLLSDYRGMAKWFGVHYNQEVRFSSAVKCKKGPQVLTSLFNQRRNHRPTQVRTWDSFWDLLIIVWSEPISHTYIIT